MGPKIKLQLVGVYCAAMAAALLYVPCRFLAEPNQDVRSFYWKAGYAFLLSPQNGAFVKINYGVLLLELLVITVLAAGVFYYFRERQAT